MDRRTFKNTLSRTLVEDILKPLKTSAAKRLDYLDQQVRLLSALSEKTDEHIIEEGLPGIINNLSKNIKDSENKNIAFFYIEVLDKVAGHFPASVIWPQEEERFISKHTDSWLLSLTKGGKRLIRSLSRGWQSIKKSSNRIVGRQVEYESAWKQEIPLQSIIKYHGATTNFIADYIQQVERLQLHFIVEMEKMLVTGNQKSIQGSVAANITGVIHSLSQETRLLSDQLEQKLEDGIAELEVEIQDQVEKAGTLERKKSYYDQQRVNAQLKNMRQALLGLEVEWKEIQKLSIERTKNILGFLKLWGDIRQTKKHFLKDIHQQFQNYLLGPLENLLSLLRDSVAETADADRSNSYQQIEKIKNKLITYIDGNLQEPLKKFQKENILSAKTESFLELLLERINQAPESLSFIFDLNTDDSPPTVHNKQIEWRLLLVRAFREQVLSPLKPSEQKYEALVLETNRQVSEIKDVLEINLESALQGFTDEDLKADGDQNPLQITDDTLQRIIERTQKLVGEVGKRYEDTDRALEDHMQQFFNTIITVLDTTEFRSLQLFITKYRVKETTGNWQQAVGINTQKSREKLKIWYRLIRRKIGRMIKNARHFLGLLDEEIEKTNKADIATYLSDTDQKLKELPYIYRRLFNFDELADERLYVPVTDSASTFKRAFEQWQESFSATFAVVGEKGSGKSTFLKQMTEDAFSNTDISFSSISMQNTIWTEQALVTFFCDALSIEKQESVDDIIELFHTRAQKQVIVLESIQHCFVRHINGYEAIEKLCYLISETKEEVFWIISCSRYGWQFLDKIQSLSEYFSHIIRTDKLDSQALEKAIMNRHRSSGYTLRFEAKSNTKSKETSKKITEEEEQKARREKYFEKLTELADGNTSIAMIFWIRSIHEFDERCFYISPLEVSSLEMIQDLNAEVLFILAAFVLHDSLSDEEMAMILDMTIQESRLMLGRLHSRGLMTLNSENKYVLNHLMYRQIIRALKDRNILHLV